MSKPTTPLSRNRIASSAISRDRAACRIAVTRQRTVMRAALGGGGLLAVGESGQHRVDHRVERQPRVDVQFGCEPDLGVHHVVGGQVLDALESDPVQCLRCLHHPDGVGERLEVAHQRPAVRGGAEEGRQVVDVVGGQVRVADCLGELQHGGRPQAAVEMVVQQRLGRLPDGVDRQRSVVISWLHLPRR